MQHVQITRLTERGGFAGPSLDADGQIIAVHDISDVWQPSDPDVREAFALAVLGDDPDLSTFDGPADAFEQQEFDSIQAQRSPFWLDPHAGVPSGFQLVP